MNVSAYFDLRYALPQRRTGVGKHAVHLLRGLASLPSVTCELLVASDQARLEIPELAPIKRRVLPRSEKWIRFVGSWMRRPFLPVPSNTDWLYCPQEIVLHAHGVRSIVTVHGLTYLEETAPRSGTWAERLERARLRWFLRRARACAHLTLVPSAYLRDQLLARGWAPERLAVVPNGVEDEFFPIGPLGAREPYVLAVGGCNLWDGGDRVVALAEALAAAGSPLKVRIAGSWHQAPILERARKLQNVELLGYVPGTQLAELMRGATAVVHLPSLESFGIIALEALAAGAPLMASRTGGLPEVAGACAFWVDRCDVETQVRCLRDLAVGGDRVEAKRVDGRKRAHQFTWANSVQTLIKVLDTHR